MQTNKREINITQAVTYPFLRQNRVNALLLPSLLGTGGVIAAIATGHLPSGEWWSLLVALLLLGFLLGYGWRLIRVLHNDGYNAVAPDWMLNTALWWDGLKLVALISVIAGFVMLPGYLMDRADEQAFQREMKQGDKSYSNKQAGERSEHDGLVPHYPSQAMIDARVAEISKRGDELTAHKMWALYLTLPLCLALMPFVWSAVVQSAETRGLLHLVNIRKSIRAGTHCYGKGFLVSLAVIAIIILSFVAVCALPQSYDPFIDLELDRTFLEVFNLFLRCLVGPIFVVATLISFHLVAQAYDDYREEMLTGKHGTT